MLYWAWCSAHLSAFGEASQEPAVHLRLRYGPFPFGVRIMLELDFSLTTANILKAAMGNVVLANSNAFKAISPSRKAGIPSIA
jgi:hypothetical protein